MHTPAPHLEGLAVSGSASRRAEPSAPNLKDSSQMSRSTGRRGVITCEWNQRADHSGSDRLRRLHHDHRAHRRPAPSAPQSQRSSAGGCGSLTALLASWSARSHMRPSTSSSRPRTRSIVPFHNVRDGHKSWLADDLELHGDEGVMIVRVLIASEGRSGWSDWILLDRAESRARDSTLRIAGVKPTGAGVEPLAAVKREQRITMPRMVNCFPRILSATRRLGRRVGTVTTPCAPIHIFRLHQAESSDRSIVRSRTKPSTSTEKPASSRRSL